MKVIILAGGLGSRLSEYTKTIPKPMVKVSGYPILIHIINHYLKYGFKEFYIASGYKSYVIKKYFKNFKKNENFFNCSIFKKNCKISIVDTGLNSLTGGRLKRLEPFFSKNDKFMFTYGDGISNVNLKKLLSFHNKSNKTITVTAVRPPARFGELVIEDDSVKSFKEKPQTNRGWINGGFFVADYSFFDFIKGDRDILEKKPLEKALKLAQLNAFKHYGFWKCMDTVRDREELKEIYKKNKFKF